MAKKVAKPNPAPEEGADDLQVLHPNRTATVAGRSITVREYGFIEGLGLRPLAQPLLDDLHAQVGASGVPELDGILVLLGKHSEIVAELVAVAADVEVPWVRGLKQDDGYILLMMWWGANGPFYVRSVFNRILAEKAAEKVRAGLTSIPPSSPGDTAAQPTSAG